ncbi:hypothetical protein OHB01_10385 [Microbispora hainanensis]|jgi:hypothetical protein|uniref:Quinol--cytochrome-c reductase n=1 Tax=Microbispora hainanensis TaxID=568844 RepID=A0ABZ1SNN4_9ACTN|nr:MULTISPECIES: hypothetical protein [Microbispora]NJP27607.1 hypothetical protein [Microbispora sp. CL1-1]TQS10853.1 hypothetical protein FLW53_26025 [Microbispora sp. SCL1-1]
MGEILVYLFAAFLITGGVLAFSYVPSGEMVSYTGDYEPLRGVQMSAAYHSILDIGFDERGLLARQLHHRCAILLGLGAVVWALLGRFRYALPVLGLAAVAALGGYGSTDDLLSGTFLARVPIPVWYGLHLVAALGVGALLVVSSRREAARQPRTGGFIAVTLGLTAMLIFLV